MDIKNKRRMIVAVVILITICLVVSGIFAYFEYFSKKKEFIEEEFVETVLDDRISPLESQGLTVTIDRIRYRGLLEKLIKPGIHGTWRNKPSFYFIVDIDSLEYISKDVEALGSASETFFEVWDTITMENRVVEDIQEEQEHSDVTIRIVERVPKGLLGLRSEYVEKEKIHITYDYRTGRWTGDDFLKDYDGYGHYVGDDFEIWFGLFQNDRDYDGIPYWTEVNVLYTNPQIDDSKLDPDEDGCSTSWEWKWGYDPFTWDDHVNLDPDIDGIENIEEYKMAKWFADPFHQDIYVEVDGMEKGGFLDPPHIMWEESKQGLIERFCQHNINMYLDDGWPDTPKNGGGEILPHYDTISQCSGMTLQFYQHHFPDERKGIFRYLFIAHGGGFSIPQIYNNVDVSCVGFSPVQTLKPIKTPWCFPTQRACRVHLGAMCMHELGHTLGIMPYTFKGNDNPDSFNIPLTKGWREYRDTWGQYYSVMNYYWVCCNDHRKTLFDYSDGSNGPPYDQKDWESLYLPTFQTNVLFIEQSGVPDPWTYDMIAKIDYGLGAVGRLEYGLDDWNYSAELTKEYLDKFYEGSPISPVKCDLRIYIKNETQGDEKNLRIYAQPQVEPTFAEYVLIREGYIDPEGNIQFYSMQDIVDDVISKIAQ